LFYKTLFSKLRKDNNFSEREMNDIRYICNKDCHGFEKASQ